MSGTELSKLIEDISDLKVENKELKADLDRARATIEGQMKQLTIANNGNTGRLEQARDQAGEILSHILPQVEETSDLYNRISVWLEQHCFRGNEAMR